MTTEALKVRIGPTQDKWGRELSKGSCQLCGGQCSPECGTHPNGCTYGGFGFGYWLISDGCELDHGESDAQS